jgi:hypothetical protein
LFGAGLERDLANTTTASGVLQTASETKEHTALQSAARKVCDALETQEGGVVGQLSLESSYTSMKRALAVMTSHYDGLDLQLVSEGFIDMPDPDLEKLVDVAEAPGAALAAFFEGEVIPLLSACEEAWAIAPMK